MESIYIKNMVCNRCIDSVRKVFKEHGITPKDVALGKVSLNEAAPGHLIPKISAALISQGFQIVDGTIPILITQIKAALVSMFNENEIPEEFKLSKFLTQKFPYDYSHISRIFSQYEKDTIEHYVIKLRIEKAKELLEYRDHNVSEVAYKLGYASAAHFSRQFKKLVGVSPSIYKENPTGRKSLDDI